MIKKYRPYLLIFSLVFVALLLTTLSTTSFFNSIISYLKNPNQNINYDIDGIDTIKQNIFSVMYNSLFNKNNLLKFDSTIIFATIYFQVFLPIFVSFTGYLYWRDLNTILPLTLFRSINNHNNLYLKTALKKAIIVASSCLLAFSLIYAFIFFFTGGALSRFNLSRELFIDILPSGFYNRHTYIYYYLVGILQFFVLPFVYAFFACAMAVLAKNAKQVFLLANSYYYGLSSICFFLAYIIPKPIVMIARYLNPSFIFGANDYMGVKTIFVLLPLLIPFLIALVIFQQKNSKRI